MFNTLKAKILYNYIFSNREKKRALKYNRYKLLKS